MRGNAAADQEFAFTLKAALKARGFSFFNEAGDIGRLRVGSNQRQQPDACCQRTERSPTNQAASL